jgi:hypothetical protein
MLLPPQKLINYPLSTTDGANVGWCEVVAHLHDNFQNFLEKL